MQFVEFFLYPHKRSFGVYRNHPVSLSVCPSVILFRVNLTLTITFELKEIRFSYNTRMFLVTRPLSLRTKYFFTSSPWPWPWLLTYFWKLILRHTRGICQSDSKEYIHVCYYITISFSLLKSQYQHITKKFVAFLTSGMFLLRSV